MPTPIAPALVLRVSPQPRSVPVPRSSPSIPDLVEVTPQQVWTTLTPTAQEQLRHTVLRVLQEVAHDTH